MPHQPPSFVTFTGADDRTDLRVLADLSSRLPTSVEWGLLYFPEKEGAPRNPTREWREQFLASVQGKKSAHLCGTRVFDDLAAGGFPASRRLKDLAGFGRIQVNINARKPTHDTQHVWAVYDCLLGAGQTIILQYNAESKPAIDIYLKANGQRLNRIHVLFDGSLGRGVAPAEWPAPLRLDQTELFCGYAGGIQPENADEISQAVAMKVEGAPYWLDMETGVRTDNQFDLDKVEAVLSEIYAKSGGFYPGTADYEVAMREIDELARKYAL